MDDITGVQLAVELLVGCGLGLMLACFGWSAFDNDREA